MLSRINTATVAVEEPEKLSEICSSGDLSDPKPVPTLEPRCAAVREDRNLGRLLRALFSLSCTSKN